MFCFGILGRKENRASIEVEMLDLNFDKLSYPAAKLVDYLEHQLVAVIVDTVEKTLKLIKRHVPDDLTKTFIPFGASACLALNLPVPIMIVVDLHLNVK